MNISLITLTQGNLQALRRTIDNVCEAFGGRWGGMIDDIIVGNLCVFEKDNKAISERMDFRRLHLPFNHLFLHGFGATLNTIAQEAKNDLCLYMNVGEIVDSPVKLNLISDKWNSYRFDHATETHKWVRLWNRNQLKWSGRIHEEVVGIKNTCPDILFTMADTPKDDQDPFYSQVMNDVKELVYFNQYLKLVDSPGEIGATNHGWVKYAQDNHQHIKDRLLKKGARYEAFVEGNLQKYLDNCTEFEPQQNTDLIHFQ